MNRPTNRPIAIGAANNAIANVGVKEEGDNRGKSIEAYQASCVPPIPPGSPWCAAFVRFRMRQAARALNLSYDPTFPRSGYTPDWARWARENNKWIPASECREKWELIRAGDLALFYFEGLGRIGHIGIIINASSERIITVEGNTSDPDSKGNEREGDGVYRKRRTWRSLGKFGGILMVDF